MLAQVISALQRVVVYLRYMHVCGRIVLFLSTPRRHGRPRTQLVARIHIIGER